MSWLDDYITELQHRPMADLIQLRQAAESAPPVRDFIGALRAKPVPAVIAEVKFKSPSQGVIRPAFDVESVAASYESAGAACLSVLVDAPYFGGDLSFLGRARTACGLPLLAKGFFTDLRDVYQVRAAGADALLLIAKCLDRQTLSNLHGAARALGMAALVELHSEADLEKVAGLDLSLVGVNHRDLDSLEMDLDLSRRLAPRLPQAFLKVAESGLEAATDLERMRALGFGAVLVGTGFMRHEAPGEALRGFLEGAHA